MAESGNFPKYADRGKRLLEFYEEGGYGTHSAFAEKLNIRQPHMKGYFTGKNDPMNLTEDLFRLGADVRYIITGIRSTEPTIPIEHKRILHQLQSHNLCTLGHITRLINIDETNRKLYNGVSVDEVKEHKPLPRQLVPKSEELFDGEPEKPTLPDWAAKQVKEKLEKKKKTHKHNAG